MLARSMRQRRLDSSVSVFLCDDCFILLGRLRQCVCAHEIFVSLISTIVSWKAQSVVPRVGGSIVFGHRQIECSPHVVG